MRHGHEWPTLVEARGRATYAATRVRTALGHLHTHTHPCSRARSPSLAGAGEGEGKGQAADAKAAAVDAQPDVDAITTALSGKLEL